MKNENIYVKKVYKRKIKPQILITICVLEVVIFSCVATLFLFKNFKKPE